VPVLALLLPALSSADVASQFRVAIGSEASFPNVAQSAQHNSYVVLQAWEAKRATELKAANPNLKVLVYQNLSAMAQGTGQGGLSSSGVNYAEANNAHPEWFLLNTSGSRISEGGYSWLWMADTANQSYQQQWTSNVIKLLSTGPWDGVMMDDTNTTARYHTEPASIAKYPTDAAYQGAIGSMLAYAGPRIQAAGKLAVPNMGSWSEYPEVVEGWLKYVSGGVDEMFAKWSPTPGQGYRDTSGWQTQIEEIQSTERMGKIFLAITQAEASDKQAILYGWGSVLLGADGHTAYSAAATYTSEEWCSECEAQIGEPTSVATKVAGGVWERSFSGGLVVVNPTTATVDVDLGGTYSGSGLIDASTATMPANTALVLHRAGGGQVVGVEGETDGTEGEADSVEGGAGGAESPNTNSGGKGSTSAGSGDANFGGASLNLTGTAPTDGSSSAPPSTGTSTPDGNSSLAGSSHTSKSAGHRSSKVTTRAHMASVNRRVSKCARVAGRGRSARKLRQGSHTSVRMTRPCR
jgi:putative glycosyl hydrolase-like family 15 (GHL15) protein